MTTFLHFIIEKNTGSRSAAHNSLVPSTRDLITMQPNPCLYLIHLVNKGNADPALKSGFSYSNVTDI